MADHFIVIIVLVQHFPFGIATLFHQTVLCDPQQKEEVNLAPHYPLSQHYLLVVNCKRQDLI